MTTTADHAHHLQATLDELQHRVRSARIWATVLANDPDPMAAALGRQFLDYLEPAQAEPVGVTLTEYRVVHRYRTDTGWSDWSVWANTEHRADIAEAALAVARSEGYDARMESRVMVSSAWTPIHTNDTDTES